MRRTYGPARSRHKIVGLAIGVPVAIVLIACWVALVAAFAGWLVMLLLGITHSTFDWPATTPGFWPCAAISFIALFLIALLRGKRS